MAEYIITEIMKDCDGAITHIKCECQLYTIQQVVEMILRDGHHFFITHEGRRHQILPKQQDLNLRWYLTTSEDGIHADELESLPSN